MRKEQLPVACRSSHNALHLRFHYGRVVCVFQGVDADGQVLWRIRGKHRAPRLEQVLALIVALVHQVDGDAALFLASGDHRLVDAMTVHAFPAVFRQQCGMDVDDPTWEGAHHFSRDQPKEARQYDEVYMQPAQFTEQGAITQLGPNEQVGGNAIVPGPLDDAGFRAITSHHYDLRIRVLGKVLHEPLRIGPRARGKYGDADHGAKVVHRSVCRRVPAHHELHRMDTVPHIPLRFTRYADTEMLDRAQAHHAEMDRRRSVREFSDDPVPLAVIEEVVRAASTAPSGAHKQPWTFCVVGDPAIKSRIRAAAEEEERVNYSGRMSDEWLEDLKPFATDWQKPFLETAPWLVVVFKRAYEPEPDGRKHQNYYVSESVGIATGMLLVAAHHAGLATLTHTPSPMNLFSALRTEAPERTWAPHR